MVKKSNGNQRATNPKVVSKTTRLYLSCEEKLSGEFKVCRKNLRLAD